MIDAMPDSVLRCNHHARYYPDMPENKVIFCGGGAAVIVAVEVWRCGGAMVEEHLTISQIAEKTGVPETTIRRYVKLFSPFLHSKVYGRAKKYHPEAVKTIQNISGMYDAGKNTAEVYEQLEATTLQIIEVENPDHLPAPLPANADVAAIIESQSALAQAFREEMAETRKAYSEDNARMLEAIEALRAEVATLREEKQPSTDPANLDAKVSFFARIRNFFKSK